MITIKARLTPQGPLLWIKQCACGSLKVRNWHHSVHGACKRVRKSNSYSLLSFQVQVSFSCEDEKFANLLRQLLHRPLAVPATLDPYAPADAPVDGTVVAAPALAVAGCAPPPPGPVDPASAGAVVVVVAAAAAAAMKKKKKKKKKEEEVPKQEKHLKKHPLLLLLLLLLLTQECCGNFRPRWRRQLWVTAEATRLLGSLLPRKTTVRLGLGVILRVQVLPGTSIYTRS
jgi:hypothetical protein